MRCNVCDRKHFAEVSPAISIYVGSFGEKAGGTALREEMIKLLRKQHEIHVVPYRI